MILQKWMSTQRRDVFQVGVAGERSATTEAETRAAIEAAFATIQQAGLPLEHIVRSRIFARDAEARRRASDTRRAELAGPLRGASASFVAPARLPDDATVMIDLVVLRVRAPAAAKAVSEYGPPVAPPEFVALDGMVFLSGNTDSSPAFADQLTRIRAKIEASLRKAAAPWSKVVQVAAFVSDTLDQDDARKQVRALFPEVSCAFETTSVAGFSAAEKLIEIEVTAELS